jgi:hypothetical protein
MTHNVRNVQAAISKLLDHATKLTELKSIWSTYTKPIPTSLITAMYTEPLKTSLGSLMKKVQPIEAG